MFDQILNATPGVGLEIFFLLPLLIALETILSADNAIALAAIARGLKEPADQNLALNLGLAIALVFRVTLILTANWVLQFWQFELLGAIYLLWLVFQYFTSTKSTTDHHQEIKFQSFWQAIPLIALTDVAFSLDSVTTAIAVSKEVWLVVTGGVIGVFTLRFLAGLFIQWLEEFVHLQDAAYVTVALVGMRLLLRVIHPDFVPPEWIMISLITTLFIWGFSVRYPPSPLQPTESEPKDSGNSL